MIPNLFYVAAIKLLILLISQKESVVLGFSHFAILDQGQFLFTGNMPQDIDRQWQHILSIRQHYGAERMRKIDFTWINHRRLFPVLSLCSQRIKF